jgi:hypothetical protein
MLVGQEYEIAGERVHFICSVYHRTGQTDAWLFVHTRELTAKTKQNSITVKGRKYGVVMLKPHTDGVLTRRTNGPSVNSAFIQAVKKAAADVLDIKLEDRAKMTEYAQNKEKVDIFTAFDDLQQLTPWDKEEKGDNSDGDLLPDGGQGAPREENEEEEKMSPLQQARQADPFLNNSRDGGGEHKHDDDEDDNPFRQQSAIFGEDEEDAIGINDNPMLRGAARRSVIHERHSIYDSDDIEEIIGEQVQVLRKDVVREIDAVRKTQEKLEKQQAKQLEKFDDLKKQGAENQKWNREQLNKMHEGVQNNAKQVEKAYKQQVQELEEKLEKKLESKLETTHTMLGNVQSHLQQGMARVLEKMEQQRTQYGSTRAGLNASISGLVGFSKL